MDEQLHRERLEGRARRLHAARLNELPNGAFVLRNDEPWLVHGDELLRWTPGGYRERAPRPRGHASLVTPPSLVAILAAGWHTEVPLVHPSAGF